MPTRVVPPIRYCHMEELCEVSRCVLGTSLPVRSRGFRSSRCVSSVGCVFVVVHGHLHTVGQAIKWQNSRLCRKPLKTSINIFCG